MDQVVAVIDQDPVGVLVAFDAQRIFAALFQLEPDLIADGLNLAGIGSRADNKEIGESSDLTEVQNPYVESFFGSGRLSGDQPVWRVRLRG